MRKQISHCSNMEDRVEKLSFFGTTGFSMWPFLKAGEKLIIKKTGIENLRIGDIILYRANSQLVCHRLIKKTGVRGKYSLWVRGDTSTSLPEPVTEQMFLGKAIGIMRNDKMIGLVGLRQQFINRIIVIIAPLLSVAVKMIRPLARTFKQALLQ